MRADVRITRHMEPRGTDGHKHCRPSPPPRRVVLWRHAFRLVQTRWRRVGLVISPTVVAMTLMILPGVKDFSGFGTMGVTIVALYDSRRLHKALDQQTPDAACFNQPLLAVAA